MGDLSKLALLLGAMIYGISADCDPQIEGWTIVSSTTGTPPPSLNAHGVVGFGDKLYVFGGVELNYTADDYLDATIYHNEVWSLDVVEKEWELVHDVENGPPARAFFANDIVVAATGSATIVMHGGSTPKINNTACIKPPHHNSTYMNLGVASDTWEYSVNSNTWTQITAPGPGPRTSHAMVATGDHQLWMFGGFNGTKNTPPYINAMNDVWMYDSDEEEWTLIMDDGNPLSPPRRHSMQFVYDGELSIYMFLGRSGNDMFNDMWMLDIADPIWTEVEIEEEYRLPMVYTETEAVWVSGKIVLFAGQGGAGGSMCCCAPQPENPTHDTWIFDPLTQRWTLQNFDQQHTLPNTNRLRSDAQGDHCVYTYGGYDFTENGLVPSERVMQSMYVY